MPMMFLVHLHI